MLVGRRWKTISCGCAKADPEVRRAARAKVPSECRRAIAKQGGMARAAKVDYRITVPQAARGLGVSEETIRQMGSTGVDCSL